MALAAI